MTFVHFFSVSVKNLQSLILHDSVIRQKDTKRRVFIIIIGREYIWRIKTVGLSELEIFPFACYLAIPIFRLNLVVTRIGDILLPCDLINFKRRTIPFLFV